MAADDNTPDTSCPYDLREELAGKTLYGVAIWGERWTEWHDNQGRVVLSTYNGSDPRPGTWENTECMRVCYSYPDGGGWCPLFQEIDGGWYNTDDDGEIVHRVYLVENGDTGDLARFLN